MKNFIVLVALGYSTAYGQTINQELDTANKFIQTVPEDQRQYVKFLTTYAIPEIQVNVNIDQTEGNPSTLRDITAKYVLPFWIHSLSSERGIRPPVQISPTMFVIDLRDYGWTPEAWEKVAAIDPYFRKPLVDPEKYDYLRLNAGNAILRADWFIIHTSDVTQQVDRKIENPLYYELIYARAEAIPKTVAEFRKFWQVENLTVLRKNFVDQGESIVSLHNRDLIRLRTPTGYYWETEDVGNMQGPRDYAENLNPHFRPAEEKDAGEMIVSNFLGLQSYFLANGKGDRVEFGDPTLVKDDTKADKRVITATSCVVCHGGGINIPTNSLRAFLDRGVNLYFADRNIQNSIEFVYLDQDFLLNVKDDRELYARAMKRVNGLDNPEENTRFFQLLTEWYKSPLDQDQVALELGLPKEQMLDRLSDSISIRVLNMVNGGKIPRNVWDELNNGVYTQSMFLVNNIPTQELNQPQKTTQEAVEPKTETTKEPEIETTTTPATTGFDRANYVNKSFIPTRSVVLGTENTRREVQLLANRRYTIISAGELPNGTISLRLRISGPEDDNTLWINAARGRVE